MKKLKHLPLLFLCFALFGCENIEEKTTIDLNELTVTQIHAAFQAKEYTAVELAEAYLDRIKQYDSLLNAITVFNPKVIEEAQALDEEFTRTGKLRPLHGIPMIVKDNFNTKGMLTTAGALALKDFVADENAVMVQQLIDAGAIIIAKSNMAEWAFSPRHTESSTFGTTHNPYNLAHVPAGSSGGTGAAMAANFGAIGLGTDTGNSIRGPSSHCSLVGFRSTLGLTSRTGVVPLYMRNDVAGPMCRTVEDATRVLEVIAGFDPQDTVTAYSKGKVPDNYMQFLQKEGLKGMRIGVLRHLSDKDPDPEIKTLFEQAIKDLEALGAEIVDPIDIPFFDQLRANQGCAEFRKDIEAFLATYVKSDSVKTLEDIIRIGTKSEYAQNGLEYFRDNSGRNNKDILLPCRDPFTDVNRIAFRAAIESQMDSMKVDVIIYPSWNHKPATIERFNEDYKGDNSQIIAPVTGQPAFTVPMGYTSGNLPAGLQFLGRMFDEPTLIKATYAYEQGTKHRVPPELK